MGIIGLIASKNYIIVNKQFAAMYGIDAAILLGELASEYDYWSKRGELNDGFFFSTVENVQESTTLSGSKQRLAISKLVEDGIIDVKLSGLPAKRHIRINEKKLSEVIDNWEMKNCTTSCSETNTTSCEKIEELAVKEFNINNNNKKAISKNNNEYMYVCSKQTDQPSKGYFGADLDEQEVTASMEQDEQIEKSCRDWGLPCDPGNMIQARDFARIYTLEWLLEAIKIAGQDVKTKNWRFVGGVLRKAKENGSMHGTKPKEEEPEGRWLA